MPASVNLQASWPVSARLAQTKAKIHDLELEFVQRAADILCLLTHENLQKTHYHTQTMPLPVLNVPTQDLSQKPRPYLRPKQLQAWLLELPAADLNAASQQLVAKIISINTARYPVDERIKLMHVIKPYVLDYIKQLHDRNKTPRIPLEHKARLTANLINDLLVSTASGYKLVVSELAMQKHYKQQQSHWLHESIYYSITFLSLAIVEAYHVYDPTPDGAWHDIHQLYIYAEANQLNDKPVDDPQPIANSPAPYTIDFAYKRLLLLSLAEPYQLMQGEAWDIFQLVAHWAGYCEISPASQLANEGDYIVDVTADASPRFVTHDTYEENLTGRIIDIDNAKHQLEALIHNMLREIQHYELLPNTGLSERQQRDMLLRLSDHWSGNNERCEPRVTAGDTVRITTGLNACHYFLSLKSNFTPEMDELKIITTSQEALDDEKVSSFFATKYQAALQKDKRHSHASYNIEEWQQHNLSSRGVALRAHEGYQQSQIKVGEVVAYRFKGKYNGRWQIGVIRWLKSGPDHSLDLGIMDMAKSAVPVAVKALSGVGKGTDYFRSLLVPYMVSLQQKRSIIVPANIYDINTILAVNLGKRIFHIRLTHLLLSSTAIVKYGFEPLEVSRV